MTVKQILELDIFGVLTDVTQINVQAEVSGIFVGDMFSHVISHAKKGSVWVTVTASLNTVAVAVLREMPCVVIADGIVPENDVILRANENGVCILSCEKSAFEVVTALNSLNEKVSENQV